MHLQVQQGLSTPRQVWCDLSPVWFPGTRTGSGYWVLYGDPSRKPTGPDSTWVIFSPKNTQLQHSSKIVSYLASLELGDIIYNQKRFLRDFWNPWWVPSFLKGLWGGACTHEDSTTIHEASTGSRFPTKVTWGTRGLAVVSVSGEGWNWNLSQCPENHLWCPSYLHWSVFSVLMNSLNEPKGANSDMPRAIATSVGGL